MSQLVVQTRSVRLKGFFARQFSLQRTEYQDRFDVLFGVVLPVLCFEFDPIVFKGGFFDGPLAADYQLLVYSISAVQITTMVIWLTFRDRFKSFSGPIAGVLFLGGLFSTVIGVVLLPFSILGLIILIGAAGFTPFLTGFVYLRNGIRGFRFHERNDAYQSRFSVGVASALFALGLPIFVAGQMSMSISNSVTTILQSDIAQAQRSVAQLGKMPFIPDHEARRLAIAYKQETDQDKKEFLSGVYFKVTGKKIEASHAYMY